MSESELTRIIDACKNARFSAEVSRHDILAPTLNLLGRRLERIKVYWNHRAGETIDYGVLANAWDRCVNLKSIEVYAQCTIDLAKAMMATPKKQVTNIHIHPKHNPDDESGSEANAILDIFAQRTACVERIGYSGAQVNGEAFDRLVARNKDSLREFSVRFYGTVTIEKTESYLPLFLKCPAFEGVQAHGFSENMLGTLRTRGIRYVVDDRGPLYTQKIRHDDMGRNSKFQTRRKRLIRLTRGILSWLNWRGSNLFSGA